MKIQEIIAFLEQKAPAALAEEWDNVGLLVDKAKTADIVVTALDATKEAVTFAKEKGATLLITHHPVIFDPLTALSDAHPAVLAMENGISVLCLHTNLDKAQGGVNDTLCEKLQLTDVTVAADGMTRVGCLPEAMSPAFFADFVSEKLQTPVMFTGGKTVKTVAVCGGGAGDGVFRLEGLADGYVTGEMKHHEFLFANANGQTVVAAGHYATEVPVVDTLTRWLQQAFPKVSVYPFYGQPPYEITRR